jgi:Tfp pilus assembly protein PilF
MRHHANRDLVQVLIQDPDPTHRSAAHRELAMYCVAHKELDKALRHFEEAAAIDPTDEIARDAAARLTAEIHPTVPRRNVLGRLRNLVRS